MTPGVLTADRVIHADAHAIFTVLTDIDRHPEIDGSGMLVGQAQGPRPLVLGSRFTMGMHQVIGYRTVNTVVEYEPDRRIAWETRSASGPISVGGHRWRYQLTPQDDGHTLVRETLDWSTAPRWFSLPAAKLGYFNRFATPLAATLQRLASLVEQA